MTAYRKFRKWNIGFRNRERLFPVLPIVIKKKKKKKINADRPTDPRFFWHVTVNTHIYIYLPMYQLCSSSHRLVPLFVWTNLHLVIMLIATHVYKYNIELEIKNSTYYSDGLLRTRRYDKNISNCELFIYMYWLSWNHDFEMIWLLIT
jgi:hypothetical protein